jgi:Domain of unknown function (DUF4328)
MVADVAVIWSDLLEIALMNRLIDEGEVYTALSEEAFADVQSNDDRQLVVTVVYTALSIVAIVFFIRWFWSAYWNLRPLGQPESRFHPAWAMVSWFIPIFNIWRPKQMANDIWRGSDPSGTRIAADEWKNVSVPALLGWWWGAWLVFSYLSNQVGRLWWRADTVESVRTAAIVDAVSSGLEIVTGVLAIAVVRRLTARQQARAAQLAAAPPPPPDTISAGVTGSSGKPG